MEQRENAGYVPLRSSLPKQCYSLLLDTGNVVILKRGETGYYKTDISVKQNSSSEAMASGQTTVQKMPLPKRRE